MAECDFLGAIAVIAFIGELSSQCEGLAKSRFSHVDRLKRRKSWGPSVSGNSGNCDSLRAFVHFDTTTSTPGRFIAE